jgi:hypothetical protein
MQSNGRDKASLPNRTGERVIYMNKAITDGVVLMPQAFEAGLDVFSSGDGTPGSDTYENASNAAFIAADQDFAGALELLKTDATQRLRYMGQTPLLPGCYLRVSAKVKAISGSFPTVRVGAYPARGDGTRVSGLVEFGPATTLSSYGEVVEINAIVGVGARNGVDMVWGAEPIYGHFGIDLTGPNGGIIRVDDIQIEDVTSVFLRDMISTVDVLDYGAIGDGTTDNTAAFEAANAAADGRTVFVPSGVFRLNGSVTFDTHTKFEGTITMPTASVLLLRRNFDLPNYIEAFEDEELAFRKAFQALLTNSDHESLDLGGRKVNVTQPLDMQAAVPDRTFYATRRVVRNGQLEAASSSAWDTEVTTSRATYSASQARTLRDVVDIAAIQVGSHVEGTGVGREIYVRSKNVATGEITLNAPLYDAEGTQDFTFSKYKYLIDFSGFIQLSKFVLSDIEFQCNNRCSGLMLAITGSTFHLRDCFISRPADRGVTSIGDGCQGMLIDRCQFLSSEDALTVPNRRTVGFNTNANDLKLRDNRATRFRHFGLIAGQNSIVTGNHFFQGDGVTNGVRSAGLILATTNTASVLANNYVDNCFIEWTNEQDPTPAFTSGFSFSALSVTDNVFLCGEVAPWFSYIVVKPHGAGHFLNGVSIVGNRFRSINGTIDRVERVDTTFSDLDFSRTKNVVMDANSFNNVATQTASPALIDYTQSGDDDTWSIDASEYLPFGGQLLGIDAIVPLGALRNPANVRQYALPHVDLRQGTNRDAMRLVWPEPVRGRVAITARVDAR